MAYTVKKLADVSGVSVRTLHFYDEIGLLRPAYVGDNGYRFYEEEQLLMLQQILFFKELGFQLSDIQRIVTSSDFDQIETLIAHRAVLAERVLQAQQLTKTIDKTIAKLKGEGFMSDKEMYLGFDKAKQDEYEKYIIEHYGNDVVDESKKKTKGWSKENFDAAKKDYDVIYQALTKALKNQEVPSSVAVQKLVRQHFDLVAKFWKPNKESYVGLGRMYLEHEDFKKLYDNYHPELATFLSDAIKVFAEKELS